MKKSTFHIKSYRKKLYLYNQRIFICMENKKYLDKVLDHMVRGVKINYDTGRVYTPFLHPLLPLTFSFFLSNSIPKDEIDYVWGQYSTIIKDKIEDGQ